MPVFHVYFEPYNPCYKVDAKSRKDAVAKAKKMWKRDVANHEPHDLLIEKEKKIVDSIPRAMKHRA